MNMILRDGIIIFYILFGRLPKELRKVLYCIVVNIVLVNYNYCIIT